MGIAYCKRELFLFEVTPMRRFLFELPKNSFGSIWN